jgi:hypothetical protein
VPSSKTHPLIAFADGCPLAEFTGRVVDRWAVDNLTLSRPERWPETTAVFDSRRRTLRKHLAVGILRVYVSVGSG